MINVRQHALQGWRVTRQFVGNHDARLAAGRRDDTSQEGLGGMLIATLLHQDVQNDTVFVDGTP